MLAASIVDQITGQLAAIIVLVVLAVLLLLTSLSARVRERVVGQWIGGFIATATRRKREEELQARRQQARVERVIKAQADLGAYLYKKATMRQLRGGEPFPLDHSDALAAVTSLQGEFPELDKELKEALMYLDDLQFRSLNPAQATSLMEAISKVTRPVVNRA